MMIDEVAAAVREAGVAALRIYHEHRESGVEVEAKGDGSPVTAADLAADKILCDALARIAPDIPVVTEERAESHSADAPDTFFLVDPVDGTKEFIRGTGEWTVNVGLIENGVPVAGVIMAPAMDRMFVADASGAFEMVDGERRPLRVRDVPEDKACVASRSHRTPETDAFIDANGIGDIVSAGSSLKFCLVAAGEADIYPRFGPTMEWDTAAGDAILRAAGGRVEAVEDGAVTGPLRYGKGGWRNSYFIAASEGCAYTMA